MAAASPAWKWAIQRRVWDALEAEGVARDPRPADHRIPNFDGAAAAAESLERLDVFQNARCVKVNPDTPQKQVRFLALSGGFAELEYGMLRYMGAIDDSTMIVTTAQLGDDIPVDKLQIHDVPVDIICTPTQTSQIPQFQSLKGIFWEKLSPEKLGQIRILRELKGRIEQETKVTLPCLPSEKLPTEATKEEENNNCVS
ncbi:hypothetical protein ACP70R_020496 [Stipagrostis hirtigluma subsp. patula]